MIASNTTNTSIHMHTHVCVRPYACLCCISTPAIWVPCKPEQHVPYVRLPSTCYIHYGADVQSQHNLAHPMQTVSVDAVIIYDVNSNACLGNALGLTNTIAVLALSCHSSHPATRRRSVGSAAETFRMASCQNLLAGRSVTGRVTCLAVRVRRQGNSVRQVCNCR